MTLQEQTFISSYIGLTDFDDCRKSCFVMALKSARKHTGRDINTGLENHGLLKTDIFQDGMYESEFFTGLTIYLLLLDQIGLVFKKQSINNNDVKNGIRLALETFTTLPKTNVLAIKALRDSLAHNFGLVSTNTQGKIQYKFTLIYSNTDYIVQSNTIWNGDYYDKDETSSTLIGVVRLCDLIESITTKLKEEFIDNNLNLRISGLEEIKTRFTIKH